MKKSRTEKRADAWAKEKRKKKQWVADVQDSIDWLQTKDYFPKLQKLWKQKENLFQQAIGDLQFPAFGGVAPENRNIEKQLQAIDRKVQRFLVVTDVEGEAKI